MVLSDGGIVCIDEFDKMRIQDRVAIHEAMEQQTISISKAGISTVLNSRTSILAAANPIFGVIDDLKTISDQIDLQSTILSRFDCIFLVKDLKSTEHDKNMAMHIMNLHTKEGNTESSEIDNSKFKELKNYILYAKLNVNPRLNEEAANTLQNYYISDRKNVIEKRNAKKSHIPVTVRQLEAIIRLSEALAKMRLSEIVTKDDVEEAHRLFTISTMNTINAGISHGDKSLIVEIQQIENLILNKLKPGDKIVYSKLLDDIKANFKNTSTISKAIHNLIKKDILKHLDRNDIVIRQK